MDNSAKYASVAMRVLYLAILTAILVVGGFVFIENQELHKLIAPTPIVRIGVLLGQFLAIVSANYFLAIRGNNLTDAKTELCLILAGCFTCVSVLGPYMFLQQIGVESAPWWSWSDDSPIMAPQSMFYFGLIPAGLFVVTALTRIYISSRRDARQRERTTSADDAG